MQLLKSIAHRFDRASLHRYVRSQYEKIHKKSMADAHSLAIRQDMDENTLKSYAQSIKASFNALHLYVLQKLEAGTVETDVAKEEKNLKEKTNQNEKVLKKLSNEREILLTDKRRLETTYNWSWYRIKLFVIPLLCLAEVALNTGAFQIYGEMLLLNMVCALGFSVTLGLAAHYFPKIIQAAEGERNKKIRCAIIGGSAFIVFLVLGWLRAKVVLINNPQAFQGSDFLYSVIGFAVINFFFFISLMVFSWLGMPSKEQWLTKEKLKQLNKEVALVEKKIKVVEDDTHAATQNLETVKEQARSKEALKQWIESLTAHTILDFTNEVSLKRTPLHSLDSLNSLNQNL